MGCVTVVEARPEHLDEISGLVGQCIADLNAKGIFQWDERYPNREFFREAIGLRRAYVLHEDDIVKGVVVLDERQADEWSAVAWEYHDGKPLVIHTLAMHPFYQGQGCGGRLLQFCESFARQYGYDSIRLDAFSTNAAALTFYTKRGYQYRGCVVFPFKPQDHQVYFCYEKRLKDE